VVKMPYKNIDIRRLKAKEYQAKHRLRKKQEKSLIDSVLRFCIYCNASIDHKKANAKFCNREHKSAYSDKKRDFVKEYAKNQKKRQAQASKIYYKDIEKSRKRQRQRQKENLPIFAANAAKRRALKLQRTPHWATKDDLWIISEAHKLAALRTKLIGIKYHVDHIIPLQGKVVSGLHVPNNIQVIPASQNIAKNNKYEVV
jgi:hypothetical protein